MNIFVDLFQILCLGMWNWDYDRGDGKLGGVELAGRICLDSCVDESLSAYHGANLFIPIPFTECMSMHAIHTNSNIMCNNPPIIGGGKFAHLGSIVTITGGGDADVLTTMDTKGEGDIHETQWDLEIKEVSHQNEAGDL